MPAVIRRVTLAPATLTPINRPAGSNYTQVSIGNGTTQMLFVYAGDTPAEDIDNFIKLGPGVDKLVRFTALGSDDIIFYLKSQPGGEVVLIWG